MTATRIRASRARLTIILGLLAVLAAVVVTSPSTAQEEPPPISAVPLTARHQFTDDINLQVRLKPEGRPRNVVNVGDPSLMTVLEITVQPGARFPWHTHPGLVFGAIVDGDPDGAFVYIYADDCVERPYEVGEAFIDPGFDNIHMAYNPSTTHETVAIGVFLAAPDEGLLTLPVGAAEGAALDEACGTDL